MIKQQKKNTQEEKIHCLWAYGPRGNSPEFFSAHFWSLLQIFKKQPFMNRTLQLFFGDFHFDILLIVLMICPKNICRFFWGDRSGTRNSCKFCFWSFDFGSWSFDFGGLDLGVLILDLGVLILDLGVLISDFGVLILVVWILEFLDC